MENIDVLRALREHLKAERAEVLDHITRGLPPDQYMKHCGRIKQIDSTEAKLVQILKTRDAQ